MDQTPDPEHSKKTAHSPTASPKAGAALINENQHVTHLTHFPAKFGRANDCEIFVQGKTISRYHAQITIENYEYFLEDLGSKNGTYIDDKKITSKQLLKNNHIICINDHLFIFRKHKNTEEREENKLKALDINTENSKVLEPTLTERKSTEEEPSQIINRSISNPKETDPKGPLTVVFIGMIIICLSLTIFLLTFNKGHQEKGKSSPNQNEISIEATGKKQ